jgi:hypothetical protein
MKRNFFNTRFIFFVLAGLIVFTLSWARSTRSVETLVAISSVGETHGTYTACCKYKNCNKNPSQDSTCHQSCYSACTYTTTTTDTLSAPTGVSATAASSSKITVSWSSVNKATGYFVYRGTTSSSLLKKATVTSTSYTDTGLSANTTYYYGIASYNSSGTSDTSTFVNSKTNTTGTLPSKNSFISAVYNGDRIIEAYLPNGRLAARTRILSTVTAKSEAVTGLGLRAGVYHLVIRDAATGNKLAFERAVIVK